MAWPTSPTRFRGEGPSMWLGLPARTARCRSREQRHEGLEVDVVGPQRRIGGPHEAHHPTGGRGGQGTALLLVGGGVRVVELVAHPDGGPDERSRRGLVTGRCAGGLAEAGAVDEREGASRPGSRPPRRPRASSPAARCGGVDTARGRSRRRPSVAHPGQVDREQPSRGEEQRHQAPAGSPRSPRR